mmetsp:Transcript_107607/g.314632  ORF Transcript_107607/g.314632 Transcript_107607/m.314632 type:complete len:274 (+) Transcript_107607:44-865(+)
MSQTVKPAHTHAVVASLLMAIPVQVRGTTVSITITSQVTAEVRPRAVISQIEAKTVTSPMTNHIAIILPVTAAKSARSHSTLRTKHTTQLAGFMRAIILIVVRALGRRPTRPQPLRIKSCSNIMCPALNANEAKRSTTSMTESRLPARPTVCKQPPRSRRRRDRMRKLSAKSRRQTNAAACVIRTPVASIQACVEMPACSKLLLAKPCPRPSMAPAHATTASCGHVNEWTAAPVPSSSLLGGFCQASLIASRKAKPKAAAMPSTTPLMKSRGV